MNACNGTGEAHAQLASLHIWTKTRGLRNEEHDSSRSLTPAARCGAQKWPTHSAELLISHKMAMQATPLESDGWKIAERKPANNNS